MIADSGSRVLGGKLPDFGVQKHAVLETHEAVDDIRHGLFVVGLGALSNPFRLQALD